MKNSPQVAIPVSRLQLEIIPLEEPPAPSFAQGACIGAWCFADAD